MERFECTLDFNTLFGLTTKIARAEESIDWLLLLEAFVASFELLKLIRDEDAT